MTNLLGSISSACFAAAVVMAVVALLLFFILHITDVRNELTGKTATAAIAQMRNTNWAERRLREKSAQRLVSLNQRDEEQSGSLRLRVLDRARTVVGGATSAAATRHVVVGPVTRATEVSADEARTGRLDDATNPDEALTGRLGKESAGGADEALTGRLDAADPANAESQGNKSEEKSDEQ
jgi:hypothetical protein